MDNVSKLQNVLLEEARRCHFVELSTRWKTGKTVLGFISLQTEALFTLVHRTSLQLVRSAASERAPRCV